MSKVYGVQHNANAPTQFSIMDDDVSAGEGIVRNGENYLQENTRPEQERVLNGVQGAKVPDALPPILESTPSLRPPAALQSEEARRIVDAGQKILPNGNLKRGSNHTISSNSTNTGEELSRLPLREHNDGEPGRQPHNSESLEQVLKLSPDKLYALTTSPDNLPVHVQEIDDKDASLLPLRQELKQEDEESIVRVFEQGQWQTAKKKAEHGRKRSGSAADFSTTAPTTDTLRSPASISSIKVGERPSFSSRTMSTPVLKRKQSSSRPPNITPLAIKTEKRSVSDEKSTSKRETQSARIEESLPSPMPSTIPMPPMSVPAYLQLDLSSSRPSPLYIHRSAHADFPYESSKVKLDRLLNFLLLPPHLEQCLWFGVFACLDAWLYTFTILPLRFAKALYLLFLSGLSNLSAELHYLASFIYSGLGRMWRRKRSGSVAGERRGRKDQPQSTLRNNDPHVKMEQRGTSLPNNKTREGDNKRSSTRHRRTRSVPSNLEPIDKADIIKGLLIICSCTILMYFDASMMYHSIRGQAAIKLYVIYNVLEVFDRLLSAIGQDVLECLFSKETLERKPNGHSKILRPFYLFVLALAYNVLHATALFYQVITLNVAVNSYSNALLTLLMSNQFVEIKSTVFKKFEKENLFQMTCADVVERFQLWLMLTIIASRNLIETNTLFSSILPSSFTLLPSWIGQILGPFLLVLGTETLVDWLKHAYICKFNLVKPAIYGRFLDTLAKDYYTHAFADQNLTRRLGLPVIPLSCLFIRAGVQTYQMFLATHLPHPLPSPSMALNVDGGGDGDGAAAQTSPATTAALLHIDGLFRRALGRHVPLSAEVQPLWGVAWMPSPDAMLAWLTTLTFFGLLFLVLLTLKVLLGMGLLAYARGRYAGMKGRERESSAAEGRRLGGWGTVEVDEDKRRWVYDDDAEGLRRLREKEREGREKEKGGGKGFGGVERYSMVAKRIW